MARYSKQSSVSEQTKDDALHIAKGIQKPGQTKEQTKLVVQGIQKGIELYKKQQKLLSRERDKLKKKAANATAEETPDIEQGGGSQKLPWVLLGLSWAVFVGLWISTMNTSA